MLDELQLAVDRGWGYENDGMDHSFGPAGFGYPQRTKGRTKDRVGERAVEYEQVGNVVFSMR
jgi:hypothetical protein